MPKVSVIITCYNLGDYIEEALGSVLAQTFKDLEIIIVNDGSTDSGTITLLKDYKKPKTRVIHTPNQGLAEARNVGIRNSSGKYILPLDADDKISPGYLADAVKVLDNDDKIKIVYCNAELFGEKSGPAKISSIPFSLQRFLISNIILCSAFFRRRDYDLTNGYNKNLMSLEDWDFWLSLLEKGGKVYKIPKTHFYYRFRNNSMTNIRSDSARDYAYKQVYFNHIELYLREFHLPISLYDAKGDIEQLRNSYEYRLGKLLLRPFRHIKQAHLDACSAGSFIADYPPRAYHFLMANYCNAACIFCNQRFDGQSKKEISFEKFKTMVSNIPIAAVDEFHFSGGGEPLLCHDLLPIVKYVNESFPWIKVIIRTNGLLIEKYSKEFAQLNISKLEISIHGMVKINDAILQKKCSNAIFSGIALLNKYLEENNRKIDIEFVPSVSMLNINEIPALIKKAAELKLNSIRLYFCRYFPYQKREANGLLKEKDSFFFHKRQYNNLIRKSARLAKSLGINLFHDPLFFKYFSKKTSCCQPWKIMAVDWDGDVYPCCGGEEWFKTKVKSGKYHFGNLLKEPVYQCWNNPAYTMLRKTCSPACKDVLISECENCHMTLCFKGPHAKNAHIIRTKAN